jgi:hypothetical protein
VVVEPAIHDTRALVHDRLAVGVYLKESTRSQLQDTHLPSRSEHAVISGNQATLMFAVHACGHQRPFRYGTRSDVASCEAATAWFRFRHGMVLVSSRKGSGVRNVSGFVTEGFWFRHGRVLVSSRKALTEWFWFRRTREPSTIACALLWHTSPSFRCPSTIQLDSLSTASPLTAAPRALHRRSQHETATIPAPRRSNPM